ncbi:MAG: C40 family peptidase [Clostridia bacterium]|nr:C40 family peptidase [Clostridia bacterium]
MDILPEGDKVSVIGEEDNWYKILYNDEIAYVYADYIESAENETTEKTENSNTPESVLAFAKNYLGVPYVYGGTTPGGFDCSGFVQYVYANFGINLPRVTYDQMNVGVPVSCDSLQVGDLLFFRGGGHVGIYAGNGTYIHAPRTGRTVSIDPLNRDVYCARRIL